MSDVQADDRVTEVLGLLIVVGRLEFGETEYRYFKKTASFSHADGPRKPGRHWVSVSDDGTEVTQEEYAANIEQSKRCQVDAFMGRLKRSYVVYDRKITKPGWREKLTEMIAAAEPGT